MPLEIWLESTNSILDFETHPHAAAGDFSRDGLDDLIFAKTERGITTMVLLASRRDAFGGPELALQVESGELDLTGSTIVASDLTGELTDLVVAKTDSLRRYSVEATPGKLTAQDIWYGNPDVGELLAMAGGDVDGDGLGDVLLVDEINTAHRIRLATSTGAKFAARDPVTQELRFMAFSALAHGAAGLAFWGQEFVSAGHVSWQRLRNLVGEMDALPMGGRTIRRVHQPNHSHWWIEDGVSSLLIVINNDRREQRFRPVDIPAERAAHRVMEWDTVNRCWRAHETVKIDRQTLIDQKNLAAYEVRIYRIAP
jgi:hypothetical protein